MDDDALVKLIGGAILAVGLVVVVIVSSNAQAACEAKGGEYSWGGRGGAHCFAKGVLLDR